MKAETEAPKTVKPKTAKAAPAGGGTKTAKAKAAPKPKAAPKAKTAPKAKAAPADGAKPAQKRAAKTLATPDLARVVAAAAMEHKLVNPVLLNVTGLSSVADWFFIATAENSRQMGAIADKIVRRAREHGWKPLGREGTGGAQWSLVDLGHVIVHLFSPEARELYDLEGLWADAPKEKL